MLQVVRDQQCRVQVPLGGQQVWEGSVEEKEGSSRRSEEGAASSADKPEEVRAQFESFSPS